MQTAADAMLRTVPCMQLQVTCHWAKLALRMLNWFFHSIHDLLLQAVVLDAIVKCVSGADLSLPCWRQHQMWH